MHGMTREASSATLSLSQTSEEFAALFSELREQLGSASNGLSSSVTMIRSGDRANRSLG
jgi:hypothetical protein